MASGTMIPLSFQHIYKLVDKLKSNKTLAGTEGTDLTQIDNNNTARPSLR